MDGRAIDLLASGARPEARRRMAEYSSEFWLLERRVMQDYVLTGLDGSFRRSPELGRYMVSVAPRSPTIDATPNSSRGTMR